MLWQFVELFAILVTASGPICYFFISVEWVVIFITVERVTISLWQWNDYFMTEEGFVIFMTSTGSRTMCYFCDSWTICSLYDSGSNNFVIFRRRRMQLGYIWVQWRQPVCEHRGRVHVHLSHRWNAGQWRENLPASVPWYFFSFSCIIMYTIIWVFFFASV